jgi:hypothetical protein
MTKIMIGLPIHRPIEFRVFESFIRLASMNNVINQDGTKNEYIFSMISNSLVYESREYIAEQFLKSDAEYLMFIDSDMTFHPASINYLLRHKKDFVTAKAFKRVPPYQPCFYTKVEYKDGVPSLETPIEYGEGLLKIEGSGLACALIHRSVFERIEKPYFYPIGKMGEDLSFCLRMKENDIEMYCDTTIQFGHLGHHEVLEKDFKIELEKAKAEGRQVFTE